MSNVLQFVRISIVLLFLFSSPVFASEDIYSDYEALLPPLIPWSGDSEKLMVDDNDPWITPSEKTGLSTTPSYDETFAWLNKLVAEVPELEMISIGKSLQGRDFWMVVASSDGNFTAQAMIDSGKPLLLAQAGIHSGEIDGKDAGLMLLRDMTVAKKRTELLEKVNFLFVPIFNVDAHERSSQFNRINQRGPKNMGWRTSARNQNFNRDYAKLDTPGVRAIVDVINEWQPDLYIDLHVTDGADYQYDITFGGNAAGGWSPSIGKWINEIYSPAVTGDLEKAGHIPGPLIMAVNGIDMQDGYFVWSGDPRYSNGYGDVRHLPTILVENHSLKPYRQRVLGTYVLLVQSIEILSKEYSALQAAVQSDNSRRPDSVVLGFAPGDSIMSEQAFKGISSERYESEISGGTVVRWEGEADNRPVPLVYIDKPGVVVEKPLAYMIPPQWADVAQRLAAHGIEFQQLSSSQTLEVEVYFLPEAKIALPSGWTPNPFEGRVRIDPGMPQVKKSTVTFPAGSYRFSTDHELGELLVLMLEPQSADSFFQWGFFLEIFTRTEYAEPYVIEPLARKMLANDPQLKAAFEEKLAADSDFAASPQQRLMWFYEKTPFYDQQYLVYPVARVMN
ncbi:MAG: murein tripeptide amidase MpaA [Lysobacterales bacterium]|jgi:murein tripeptide amidase MpaA